MAQDPHDHDHDHDDDLLDEEMFEDEDIVVLTDEEGQEMAFRFLTVIEVEEQDFALLTPAEEPEDPEAPTEIFIFHYSQDEDGGEMFAALDDQELFARVQAAAEQALSQEVDDEEAN